VNIASVESLEGLTIGRLASVLGISKSGLFAHFGSKEDLQCAVVDEARDPRARADRVQAAATNLFTVSAHCPREVSSPANSPGQVRDRYFGGPVRKANSCGGLAPSICS
jgi:AcrR family transcriptional regulator